MRYRIGRLIQVAALAALFIHLPLLSQAQPDQGIAGNWYGADWRSWNDTQKTFYLIGFRAGSNAGANMAIEEIGVEFRGDSGKRVRQRVGVAASVAQLKEGVDSIYKDYKNLNIPVWTVVMYTIDSIGGFDSEQDLERLRRFYSRPPS